MLNNSNFNGRYINSLYNNSNCNYQYINSLYNTCQCNYQYLLSYPNVVGIGVGLKTTNNIQTSRHCLCVMVEEKISKQELNPQDIIPMTYMGQETDVIEVGKINLAGCLAFKRRPLVSGLAIESKTTPAIGGTLGPVVKYPRSNDLYMLSCFHVLNYGFKQNIGVSVMQPPTMYGGTNADVIGTVSNSVLLVPEGSGTNKVDAGLIKLNANAIASLTTELAYFNQSKGYVKLTQIGTPVATVGFMSGLTFGNITALGVTVKFTYAGKNVIYTDQILASTKVVLGDSGGVLVVTSTGLNKGLYAGLVMGESPNFCICNDFTNVLTALGVELASKIN